MTPEQSAAIAKRHKEIEARSIYERVLAEMEILGANIDAATRAATLVQRWRANWSTAHLGYAANICTRLGIEYPPTLNAECALMAEKLALNKITPTTIAKIPTEDIKAWGLRVMGNFRSLSEAPKIERAAQLAAQFLSERVDPSDALASATLYDLFKKRPKEVEHLIRDHLSSRPDLIEQWQALHDDLSEKVDGRESWEALYDDLSGKIERQQE